MSITQRFRQQHDELLSIAKEISGYLSVNKIEQDAAQIRTLLSRLLGKLKIHLAMEDKSLYPKLLDHSDDAVVKLTKDFINEMSGIGQALAQYQEKWSTPANIQQAPKEFIEHTKGIFDALVKRIDKENNQLYALLE